MAVLAILIDGAYLDRVAEDDFHARIDYRKLIPAIHKAVADDTAEPLSLLRTYYYNALPFRSNNPAEDEAARYSSVARFFDFLGRLPKFEVRLGNLALRGSDSSGRPILEQKQVDVLLALDIVLLSTRRVVTHLAIITGDSDLLPAVRVAREEGASIWIFHGPYYSQVSGYSNELWNTADMRFEINQEFVNQVQRRCQ